MLPLVFITDLLLILVVILLSIGMFFALILESNPNADFEESLNLAPPLGAG